MPSDGAIDFIAGWFGGLANIFTGHPFDTVKVRMQTSTSTTTAIRCVLKTFRAEGVHGFYKGMAFPLVSVGAMNSILFGVYGNVLKAMGSRSNVPPTYLNMYLAGCVAGAAQLVVACPTEVVKTKLQVQTVDYSKLVGGRAEPAGGAAAYRGPVHCLGVMLQRGGVRAWYQGLLVTGLRDIPASGLYILVYEYLCDVLSGGATPRGAAPPSPLTAILAGGTAGVLSWGSIIPFDVVKSRIQSDSQHAPRYSGILHCVRESYRAEGLPVFFRGFLIISVRAFPTNAAIFLVYSWSLDRMRRVAHS